jgi:hypothetical protein
MTEQINYAKFNMVSILHKLDMLWYTKYNPWISMTFASTQLTARVRDIAIYPGPGLLLATTDALLSSAPIIVLRPAWCSRMGWCSEEVDAVNPRSRKRRRAVVHINALPKNMICLRSGLSRRRQGFGGLLVQLLWMQVLGRNCRAATTGNNGLLEEEVCCVF